VGEPFVAQAAVDEPFASARSVSALRVERPASASSCDRCEQSDGDGENVAPKRWLVRETIVSGPTGPRGAGDHLEDEASLRRERRKARVANSAAEVRGVSIRRRETGSAGRNSPAAGSLAAGAPCHRRSRGLTKSAFSCSHVGRRLSGGNHEPVAEVERIRPPSPRGSCSGEDVCDARTRRCVLLDDGGPRRRRDLVQVPLTDSPRVFSRTSR